MPRRDPKQEDGTDLKVSTLQMPDPISKQIGAIARADGLPVSEVLRVAIGNTSPVVSRTRDSKSAWRKVLILEAGEFMIGDYAGEGDRVRFLGFGEPDPYSRSESHPAHFDNTNVLFAGVAYGE